MKTLAVIQARMASTRLPGKVMRPVRGLPMLARVVERVRLAQQVDGVVVAASNQPVDQPIWKWCDRNDVPCVRGHAQNVLSRYLKVIQVFSPDRVVRITSDCPLIDPDVIDRTVLRFKREPEHHYVCNFWPTRTYPRGLDAEVFSCDSLQRLAQMSLTQDECEHVTLKYYREPDRFRIAGVVSEFDHSILRWTVDTSADLQLVNEIYQYFGADFFGYPQIISAYQSNPHWQFINQHIQQKVA